MKDINKKVFGTERPLLFSGPCAIESEELCMEVAGRMKEISNRLGFHYIFKASFDKANRTSVDSFRGPGLEKGLEILEKIKNAIKVPVITDVHETIQVKDVAKVVDVIQIPAFLCRQTDILIAAGKSGAIVNIKKGQFMAPEDMEHAVLKVKSTGNEKIYLTERGTTFGYHNLTVDFRSLPIMRDYAGVIFDITHSVQRPGGLGGKSGGNREFTPFLSRAAAAVGVDGFFMETHPNPEKAKSDGPNMIPLDEAENFLKPLIDIRNTLNK